MKEYAIFVILGIIFFGLIGIYFTIYSWSKRYNNRIKRLKKLKTRLKGIRRKHVRF